MTETRDNHYVPQWYQRGFLSEDSNQLFYLDLDPENLELPDGRVITKNSLNRRSPRQCFYQTDLYTTFFGDYINDEIERILFGQVDDSGARAVRAFLGTEMRGWHDSFQEFFSYIDIQKIRIPKGLDWIRANYPELGQVDLMTEMQAIRHLNCTLWTEGVREIVSAKNSTIKFIISDHPVTIYNYACPPDSELCQYPDDPSIAFKATQTIFPLNKNHCLILTNLEYGKEPDLPDPLEKRANAKLMRNSMARVDAFIRGRELNEDEVSSINLIIKKRAKRYIAASNKEWLFPEKQIDENWKKLGQVLLPASNELYRFGGEMYAGYDDGRTYYQDAFGRTMPENKLLRKDVDMNQMGPNKNCGCGSGKKYKKCCMNKKESDRPSWKVLSIRERNMVLYRGVEDILGLNKGKIWKDIQRELSNEQIKRIYKLYWGLWPPDTDLVDLLPRPDDSLRVVYTGVVDPRTTSVFALGMAPYVDELLIQHPFLNPGVVAPEYNPIDNPHQHKVQTLRNIALFLWMKPFIQYGVVNFFPDPCSFDHHLRQEMQSMANNRFKRVEIGEEEKEKLMQLQEDDFKRAMRNYPKEVMLAQIKKALPDLSDDEVNDVHAHIKTMNEADPLALLQDDLMENGGQLMISNMVPNYEIALMVAQLTGAAVLTDSNIRWSEFQTAQVNNSGQVSYPFSELVEHIANLEVLISADPDEAIGYRLNGSFGQIRKAFAEVKQIAENNELVTSSEFIERLKNDLARGLDSAVKSMDKSCSFTLKVKLSFLIPKGGFVDKNVHRLLIKSGSKHHRMKTSLVILIQPLSSK